MMRRLFVLLLLPLFVVGCLAVEAGEGSAYSVLPDTDLQDVLEQLPEQSQQLPFIQYFAQAPQSADLRLVEVETYSLEPITPSDASGLKAVLLSVLGDYESIVTDYRYQNTNGTYSYLREVQPDYVFLCACGVFALLLWCVFRMAGGLFCRK